MHIAAALARLYSAKVDDFATAPGPAYATTGGARSTRPTSLPEPALRGIYRHTRDHPARADVLPILIDSFTCHSLELAHDIGLLHEATAHAPAPTAASSTATAYRTTPLPASAPRRTRRHRRHPS
jgi:hypothetical protein